MKMHRISDRHCALSPAMFAAAVRRRHRVHDRSRRGRRPNTGRAGAARPGQGIVKTGKYTDKWSPTDG